MFMEASDLSWEFLKMENGQVTKNSPKQLM